MIRKLTFISSLFLSTLSFGQTCSSSILEDNLYSPSLLITCDFNGDNRQDVVFADSLSNNLFWKKNNGNNQFSAAIPLVGGAKIRFLKSGDLNNDGYEEILFTTSTTIYYISYTGASTIDFQSLLDTPTLYYIEAFEVGDFDSDGSDGMVVGYVRNSTLSVMVDVINNVNGNMTLKNIANATLGTITDLAVGDITGDGKLDIAMAGYSNLWFKNLSGGNFSAYKTISSAGSDYGRIFLMDYDNDSKMELVNLDSKGTLQTYNIDPVGTGVFGSNTIISGLPTSSEIWKKVNKDGKDVLLVGTSTELIGLENTGNTFVRQNLCTNLVGLKDAALMKNQDGSTDYIYSSDTEGKVYRINLSSVGLENLATVETKLYPNPTNGEFFIQSEAVHVNIRVMNVLGQAIEVSHLGDKHYSLEDLPVGLYRVLLETEQGVLTSYNLLKED